MHEIPLAVVAVESSLSLGRRTAMTQSSSKRRNPNALTNRPSGRISSRGGRGTVSELTAYFSQRSKNIHIVATTYTPSGHTLDWIPIESQIPGGKIASPPPEGGVIMPSGGRRLNPIQFELQGAGAERGPKGTVPVLRQNPTKLPKNKTLKDFLSKHQHAGTRYAQLENGVYIALPYSTAHHRYANTSQSTTCYGGQGILSVWRPYAESSGDMSLMQIGVTRGDDDQLQSVEAGWQVLPDLYNDSLPHLFTFYTTNAYSAEGDNLGGYNQNQAGWVQYGTFAYPGATLSPVSTAGGEQYIMPIKYQLYQGNWWFQCLGSWIGYYPASLYARNKTTSGTLGESADRIGFWGEIYDAEDAAGKGRTRTTMGSGFWAEDGWTWSAYQSNLQVQSDSSGTLTDYDGGTGWASDPDMYNIACFMKSGTNSGSYFYMGGPGAN